MIPSPLPWALERIRAGRDQHAAKLPRYGSPEWEALPPGSAARWAAVVLAAECWRTDGLIAVADLEYVVEIEAEPGRFVTLATVHWSRLALTERDREDELACIRAQNGGIPDDISSLVDP